MAKPTLSSIISESQNKNLIKKLGEFAEAYERKLGATDDAKTWTIDTAKENLSNIEEYFYAQFTGKNFDGEEMKVDPISWSEAMDANDLSIALPRVISEVLKEPVEPNLFLLNSVAEVVTLPADAPLNIEFPKISAIDAIEMDPGQDYPVQSLSIAQDMVSIRLRKYGTATAITEELKRSSLWPLLAILMKMCKNAVNRKIESVLYDALIRTATPVFDNEQGTAAYRTSGVSTTQAWNGSFAYDDLVKMFGVLLGRKYNGTHLLAHPLAWPIFLQDPVLRAQFYNGGQIGQGIWGQKPQYDQTGNIPFGVIYVPYYAMDFAENYTLTGAGSGLGAALTTDMFLIDQKNSLYLASRGDVEMDQMDNWFRDSTMVKARRLAGASVKDGGKGIVSAKKVRVVKNFQELFTVRTVTS